MRDSFHGEGDETGDYKLSGMWRITMSPISDAFGSREKLVVVTPSWSGNAWSSPGRRTTTTVLLSLGERGSFATPPDCLPRDALRGKWSCEGDEVTLACFGRFSQVVEWYTGRVRHGEQGSLAAPWLIRGNMAYGATDPEFAGTFQMARVLPLLNPLVPRKPRAASGPSIPTKSFAGQLWSLEHFSSSTASVFLVRLNADLSWETVSGVGAAASEEDEADMDSSLRPRLAGKWNCYDEQISLGSGIAGAGPRLWIWVRRFGSARAGEAPLSRGVSLAQDQLLIGTIHAHDDDKVVRSVTGHVAVGWAGEPAFVGRFTLKPWSDAPDAPVSDKAAAFSANMAAADAAAD